MAGKIETRLAELGITLPVAATPLANYVPFVVTGNLVMVSGQIPVVDGRIVYTGKISQGMSIQDGQDAARRHLPGLQQPGDACGEHARLAGACAREHETWPTEMVNGLELCGIQG